MFRARWCGPVVVIGKQRPRRASGWSVIAMPVQCSARRSAPLWLDVFGGWCSKVSSARMANVDTTAPGVRSWAVQRTSWASSVGPALPG